jgi:ferredoxin
MNFWRDLEQACTPSGLFLMGALHPCEDGIGTLILLGAGPACWPVFTAAPEYRDGARDPLDRWSKRIVGSLASTFADRAIFPSDGPPYAPFIRWAEQSGRFFQSPTGMLVHDTAGLMISIRGALARTDILPLPHLTATSPCAGCPAPCTTACPVGALSADAAYDVPACKGFLATDPGQDCMDLGCAARRACPLSQAFGRDPAQSAFHMTAFKG